jgi:predicted nucleic acid-binding protein
MNEVYTIDSVAFLGFIIDDLPEKADQIFQKAENDEITLILPSIALGEIIYTILKKKEVFGKIIPLEKISIILEIIRDSESICLKDMNLECWKKLLEIQIPELHDRMIVATHLTYNSTAIITNDNEIVKISNTI